MHRYFYCISLLLFLGHFVFRYRSHKLLYRLLAWHTTRSGLKLPLCGEQSVKVIRQIGVNTVQNVNKFGLFSSGIYAKSIEILRFM